MFHRSRIWCLDWICLESDLSAIKSWTTFSQAIPWIAVNYLWYISVHFYLVSLRGFFPWNSLVFSVALIHCIFECCIAFYLSVLNLNIIFIIYVFNLYKRQNSSGAFFPGTWFFQRIDWVCRSLYKHLPSVSFCCISLQSLTFISKVCVPLEFGPLLFWAVSRAEDWVLPLQVVPPSKDGRRYSF